MEEALAQAQELVARWDAELRRILPPDQPIFDAHVHLGNDIDGMVGSFDELARLGERYGIARSFMFCLDSPTAIPRSARRTTGRSRTPSAPRVDSSRSSAST